jgi:hypothetical protein
VSPFHAHLGLIIQAVLLAAMVFVCTTIGWLIAKGPRRARKSDTAVAKALPATPERKAHVHSEPLSEPEKAPSPAAPVVEEPRPLPDPKRPSPPAFSHRDRPARTFEKDVLPIMRSSCISCHGGMRKRAGLDLRTRSSLLRGGENGPGVKPGDPAGSLLLESVTTNQMPPGKKKLTAAEKQVIREWIATGAKGER